MAKLLVHENAGVREFEMVDAEVHIGRELDNTLRLPDPSISRHHCMIRKTAAGYEIQDLQSSNGVLLNGSRVQSSPLRDGDRVTLGQIQLTFVNPVETSPAATVAIQVPANPLGTVRMTPDQMAAIHGGAPKTPAAPPAAPIAQPTADVPVPVAPMAPPPAAPAPVPPPPAPPAPAPLAAAPMAALGEAPEFGHFTGLTAAPSPLPGFILGMLPPNPDPAKHVGPGELGDRIVAGLIDVVPIVVLHIALSIVSAMLLFAMPMVLPLMVLLIWGTQLAYIFLFMPLCIAHHGGTWGKKVMKLRVVPTGQPTARLPFGKAVLHQLGYFLSLINLIVIAVNDGKGIGNLAAGSDTIKVDR
jgi:uncharacterized RDD family membrane protein YckC